MSIARVIYGFESQRNIWDDMKRESSEKDG
jgi:hypothetical protein